MLATGKIRICPASYYSDPGHLEAVRDDEITRVFCFPTFSQRLKGDTYVEVQGHRIPIEDDDLVLPLEMPDYYLLSLFDEIYYRMPTDFDADAALVIRDPVRFTQAVVSSFLARWPDWTPVEGPVTYYDPYRDYTRVRVTELSKRFGYTYQREVRIAFLSRQKLRPLNPRFLEIGSMTDYAELLSA